MNMIEPWQTRYKPNWTQANFKGVSSNVKAQDGNIIKSGQWVKVSGRLSPLDICEVYFEPNHGFKIQGNNLADAYVHEVLKDVPFFVGLWGIVRLFFHSLKRLFL